MSEILKEKKQMHFPPSCKGQHTVPLGSVSCILIFRIRGKGWAPGVPGQGPFPREAVAARLRDPVLSEE